MQLRSVEKRYGPITAVADVSLDIEAGEFISLLGPSGSGKTTTLLMIAGFAVPTAGRILLGGRDITYVPPHRRNIGMVYQHYALFPHMSVFKNVAFPLRMRKVPKPELKKQVERALSIVQLEGMENRLPSELSGGQQQRVALARAIVFHPPLLLMDEPLGALDKKLRDELQIEIKRIQRETRNTVIYVTHDQDEALNMSDRVVVMNHGRVEQVADPLTLYEKPGTPFVADFMGGRNLFDAVVIETGQRTRVRTEVGTEFCVSERHGLKAGQRVKLTIRPERITLRAASAAPEGGHLGKVVETDYYGNSHRYQIRLASGDTVWAICSSSGSAPVGRNTEVCVEWPQSAVWIIPEAGSM